MLFVALLGAIPDVQLNNGVVMPMISLGTWQYSPAVAQQTVTLGMSLGFNHIDTALDYKNQEAVGKALAPHNRSTYFLTTKIPPQIIAKTAYSNAMKDLEGDLTALGLDYVDLMLVHFPPKGNTIFCGAMQEQWRAMEDFYKAKKARAIGVSNYCQSSFECILKTANVTPAVNQIQYHVGMSPDPSGIKSYADQRKIVTQSYSPLGDGTTELINGPMVSKIGDAHNKTGAQVSLHWVVKHGVPVSTKSTKASHLKSDLGIFDWDVTDAELKTLDDATSPPAHYSFMCQK